MGRKWARGISKPHRHVATIKCIWALPLPRVHRKVAGNFQYYLRVPVAVLALARLELIT